MVNMVEKEFSAGNLFVTIWKNTQVNSKTGKEFESRSLSFEKRYKSGEEWKSTQNLKPTDVPMFIQLLSESYRFVGIKSH